MADSSYTPNAVMTADGRSVPFEHLRDSDIYSCGILKSDEDADVTLFGYKRGDTVPGGGSGTTQATLKHTNVGHKGKMPQNERILIYMATVEFENDIEFAAVQASCDDLILQVHAGGDVSLLEEPLKHFPQGTGVGVFSTANNVNVFSNGPALWENRRRLALPILIDANDNYDAVLKVPTTLSAACANFTVRVNFFGQRSQPN